MELKTEIKRFLDTLDRSPRTVFTYQNALEQFVYAVGQENVELTAEIYTKFLATLKSKSPSTQRVYTTAVRKLYAFCKVGDLAALKEATDHFTRKQGKRIVNFNREAVEQRPCLCAHAGGYWLTDI
jgi:site-specific recombinase XerD